MLKLHNINKSFDKKAVLKDVSITFTPNQLHAIIGSNGAGKSTLLNLITGNIVPDSGNIILNDHDVRSEKDWASFKSIIGFSGQNDFLVDELSSIEYVQLIGIIYRIPKPEILERSELLFKYFDLDEKKVRDRIGNLSFGTRKKIGFCALFLNNPKIIILDEPFAGLDKISSRKLVDLLKRSLSTGGMIILATHTFDYIAEIIQSIFVIEDQTCRAIDKNNDRLILEKYIQLDDVENTEQGIELNWIK
jgi:ABC-2 type transport system ATP-binding protein